MEEGKKEGKKKQKKKCGKDTGGRINEHATGKQTQERRKGPREREESKNVKWQKMKNGEKDSRKRENKI